MGPLVAFTIWATPALPLPPWVSAGHSTVAPDLRVHAGPAATRNLVKFSVVPEPSERWATTIGVGGKVVPGLSPAIAALSHVLMVRWKMPAIVSGESLSVFTSDRL